MSEVITIRKIQGRCPTRDGYGPWGTICTVFGEDKKEVEAQAQAKLLQWGNHSADGRGPFCNWQFRVVA